MKKKAIFIDKDGTLTKNVPYNINPNKISFLPGAVGGLRVLQEWGYELFIISNQSGIARGYFSLNDLQDYFQTLLKKLSDEGIFIKSIYYCPHHPEGVITTYKSYCNCRKPQPGLLQKAAIDHDVDLSSSWIIGDILNDIEAGKRAGTKTILIDNGGETEWDLTPKRTPDIFAPTILSAVQEIQELDTYHKKDTYYKKTV